MFTRARAIRTSFLFNRGLQKCIFGFQKNYYVRHASNLSPEKCPNMLPSTTPYYVAKKEQIIDEIGEKIDNRICSLLNKTETIYSKGGSAHKLAKKIYVKNLFQLKSNNNINVLNRLIDDVAKTICTRNIVIKDDIIVLDYNLPDHLLKQDEEKDDMNNFMKHSMIFFGGMGSICGFLLSLKLENICASVAMTGVSTFLGVATGGIFSCLCLPFIIMGSTKSLERTSETVNIVNNKLVVTRNNRKYEGEIEFMKSLGCMVLYFGVTVIMYWIGSCATISDGFSIIGGDFLAKNLFLILLLLFL